MARSLQDWLATEVKAARRRPMRWLSERYFFRDPVRPVYSDPQFFFAPADGILLYQRVVEPDQELVEIKGRNYTLREALRDPDFPHRCLAIGIFMTSYDVHVNRAPYAGTLSYRALPVIGTRNRPMLAIEEGLLRGHPIGGPDAAYLFSNQRMLNRVHAARLGLTYYILQIADYDMATILPFELRQSQPLFQNQRFSQIRFGSQVDLIIPVTAAVTLECLVPDGFHVEAGIDPLVRVAKTARSVPTVIEMKE